MTKNGDWHESPYQRCKMISDANPDVYIIGRSGLFGLTPDIASSWDQMVEEYETETGYRIDNGVYVNN